MIRKCFLFFIVVLSLKSMMFYYLSAVPEVLLQLVVIVLAFFIIRKTLYHRINQHRQLFLILLLDLVCYVLNQYTIGHSIFTVLLLSICLVDNDLKIRFLPLYSKVLAGILAFSLFFYILDFVGIRLIPYHSIEFSGGSFFSNYFTIISNLNGFNRFQGLFREPGHLGMIAAVLLYCNRFDLKKSYNIILLISLVFSFSLAGYVICALGWLADYILVHKITLKRVFFFFILALIMVGVVGLLQKSETGYFNQLIFERLTINNGTLAGNNRYSSDFLYYYNTHINDVENLLFGYKFFDINNFPGNSGYKTYLIEYGLIAIILLLSIYICILFKNPTKKGFILFSLFVLLFLQRPYLNWFVLIMTFVSATTRYNIVNYSNEK